MQNKLEEATAKHLRLLIEELADKNITGIRFLKQGNKVMLLFDKMLLSKTNQQILNALNVTYPNIIVSINDSENPFDYEELYEPDSEKINKKVRPYDSYCYSVQEQTSVTEYFDRFRFTGIELDTDEISATNIQFGYFLEFINAFQEQDVLQYENMKLLDENIIQRHEHYLRNGSPDKRHIALWVHYNEELIEYSNGLKVSDDPYLSKLYIAVLNKGASSVNEQHVKLTLDKINQNVQDYLKRRLQDDEENPPKKYIEESSRNRQSQIEEDYIEIE